MKRLGTLLVLIWSTGCAGKLYQVHRGTTPVDGVPFYVLAGSCTQETVRLETVYQLVLQFAGKEGSPARVLREKPIPASVYNSTAMQELRDAVAAEKPKSASAITSLVDKLPAYNPAAQPELVIVSNTTKADTYVDYSKVHYINVSRPGIGSASAAAKLNANGTLSESSAEVEDKTAETILGAFPIKEAVTGILSAGGLGIMVEGEDAKSNLAVQLSVTALRFNHTLSKTEAADPPCPARAELKVGDPSANSRREAVSEGRDRPRS